MTAVTPQIRSVHDWYSYVRAIAIFWRSTAFYNFRSFILDIVLSIIIAQPFELQLSFIYLYFDLYILPKFNAKIQFISIASHLDLQRSDSFNRFRQLTAKPAAPQSQRVLTCFIIAVCVQQMARFTSRYVTSASRTSGKKAAARGGPIVP